MARPRIFKEEDVLQKIKNTFWEHGYEGTSYTDLIKASGLHKGSLYAAFGDKRALYIKALETYDKMEVSAAVDLLSNRDSTDGKQAIEMLYQMVVEAVRTHHDRRGCLLCNAAVDQAPHHEQTEEHVRAGLQRMQDAYEAALEAIPDPQRRQQVSSTLMAVYFGMRVLAKSGAPIELMEQAYHGVMPLLDQQKDHDENGF